MRACRIIARAAALVFLSAAAARALEADMILPEILPQTKETVLSAGSERRAACIARFLEAVFEEESHGPDRALASKREVLALDPGFTDLAMDVARQYLRRGDVPEAISVLKDAAKSATKRAEPQVALAGIYLRQLAKPDLAEKFASQALAACPDDSAPYQILYEIYRAGGQSAKREALFSKALKRPSPPADFWLDLAELRLREPAPPDSPALEQLLNHAQAAAGDRPEPLVRAAGCFLLANRPERAVPLFQLALALRPSLPGVRDRLAAALLQTGKTDEAASTLQEILRADPLDLRAYDQLADLYFRAGNFSSALANMRQALLIAPPDPRRHDRIIRLSLAINDGSGALKAAEDAIKQFPAITEFLLFRALAMTCLGQPVEAIKIFERILVEAGGIRPDLLDAEFFFSYGIAAERAGRFGTASELFKKSIELDPLNSARACNYLGYMWAERGENLAEAEQLIRRALEADPENGAYLDSLGWALFRQGRYEDSLHELLRAAAVLQGEPDPVVFEHIGDAYEKLEKSSEAVLYWQKSFLLAPGNSSLPVKIDRHSSRIVKSPAESAEGR
ncbi:MAG: tetratricopeptide repeat protein [Verrucomicrobiae bacterium]